MKIYGIDKEETIKFIDFYRRKKGVKNLSEFFYEYALLSKKAVGTVRNMYYAIAKKAKEDDNFRKEYLKDTEFNVSKIEGFKEEEERKILKAILKKKMEGFSVRQAVFDLAKGDVKLQLRYQNKYRTAIKNQPLIEELIREVKLENPNLISFISSVRPQNQIKAIEREINGLVNRIYLKLRKENEFLNLKIKGLEEENDRLKEALNKENTGLIYFRQKRAKENS